MLNQGALVCTECKNEYELNEKIWRCKCGGLLNIDFKYKFSTKAITDRPRSIWRYREALPIFDDKNIVTLDEGFTPLLPVDINGKPVLMKQDQLMPTGSFKDRGASVLISKVKELGIKQVIIDSSGNAGSAVAAYCNRAHVKCDVYAPAHTSPAKLTQIINLGAQLIKIDGSREDTAQAALVAAKNSHYASHYWNPFFMHGTKTFAFEVWEQLGWDVPDTIILPVGNGTILLGAHIGFSELYHQDLIRKTPKIIAVQSAGCAPLVKAFKNNLPEIPEVPKSTTIAEGIAINRPVRGKQIINAVKQTDGDFIEVTDDEIETALKEISSKGFCIEPTAAATVAGITKYLAQASNEENIVAAFTGHGAKTPKKLFEFLGQ